ncbi:MAG: beta strand repeat-containing protein [Micromonosporaceae bacterium]
MDKTADTVDANPGDGVCADSVGGCSLRAAVMEANALANAAGADVIDVAAGTYLLTRTSTGPADPDYENDNFCSGDNDTVGDLDLKAGDVSIVGAGAGVTVIDANGIDRAFDSGTGPCGLGIDPPGNTINVSLSGMTLQNGYVDEVYDNDPTGNSGQNFADGAAIRYDGYDVPGGGLNDHTLSLTNVTVANNTAEWNGGGVFARFATLDASGLTLSGNTAQAGDGGGAIWLPRDNDTLTLTNSTITGNSALFDVESSGPQGGNGGGLNVGARGSATFSNVSVNGNQAEIDGGGLYQANKAFSMTGGSVIGNKAGDDGGGSFDNPDTSVIAGAASTYTNVTIQSNAADGVVTGAGVATNDGVGDGGGILHFKGLLTLTGSTIGGGVFVGALSNTARNGGGIAFLSGTSNVTKNQILANRAIGQGGGVYQSGGTFTAHFNRFWRNQAAVVTDRGLRKTGGTLVADNNWWGCNQDPTLGTAACDTVAGGGSVNPRLVLTHTASPNIIYATPPPAGQPNATTLTASVLKNSAGTPIPVSDLDVLIGLPIVFDAAVFGTLSGADTVIGPTGTATATFTAGAVGGPGHADATVDSAKATALVDVYEPPVITVPADITVTEDAVHSHQASVSWTTSATGYPVPTITCKIGATTITSPHTFTEGPTTVDCTASSAAGSDTKSFTVTVQTSPTLSVPAPITVTEDTPGGGTASVTFTASALGYPSPVGIVCKIGATEIGSGNDSVTITRTFAEGETTVSCTADNGVNPPETKTFTVTVQTGPAITVPADITVTEDTPGGGTASVSWTTSATGVPAPTIECTIPGPLVITSPHTFPLGTTTVTCTATNSVGSDSDTFDVTVVPQNRPPAISHTGPYLVGEGGTVLLDASGTSDPDGDPVTIAWDLDNNGSYETAGATPTFDASAIDGPASRTVGIEATDSHGESTTATTTVDVVNVDPALGISGPTTVGAGDPFSLSFTATDPAPADQAASFTYVVNWGDGSPTQTVTGPSPTSLGHTYAAAGSYTVSATATDKDGGVSTPATYEVSVFGVGTIDNPCGGGSLLRVSGTTGGDQVLVTPASGGMVKITINGTVVGTFSPGEGLVIHGLDGNDTVTVHKKISRAVVVFAGDGNDTVDAGNGTALVVAGDGADQVTTRNGRDILIGGAGADKLNGGNGDDILIAGTTSYDTAGLADSCGLRAEWTRTDADYATRVGHLDGSIAGGLNGTSYLKGPGPGQTVFDDTSADLLPGGSGMDWFFYNYVAPGVLDTADRTSAETRTDL